MSLWNLHWVRITFGVLTVQGGIFGMIVLCIFAKFILASFIWLLDVGRLPDIGMMVRVFANGPGRVIPKTQKMVLDSSLLNTQHYKVRIKGKVEQSRERNKALSYTLVK